MRLNAYFLTFLLLLLTGGLLLYFTSPGPGIHHAAFARIQPGMNIQQVEAVLGRSANVSVTECRPRWGGEGAEKKVVMELIVRYRWSVDKPAPGIEIWVAFDETGAVLPQEKSIIPEEQPNFISRLLSP